MSPRPNPSSHPFSATPNGTRIALKVQPRASRTEIVGIHGDAVRVRLTAPPVDGVANEALLRFLADRLGVAYTALALVAGATGRSKTVVVEGMAPADVAAKLVGR